MSDAPQSRPCPDCASPVRTTDQSFCDSCGAFLRWDTPAGAAPAAGRSAPEPSRAQGPPEPTGEAPEASAAPEVMAPAESAPATGSAAGSVSEAGFPVGSEEVTAPLPAVPSSAEAPAPVPVTETTAPVEPAAPAAVTAPTAPAAGPSETVARSLLVPVPESRPAEPAVVAPVLPARPEAARPAVRAAAAPAPVEGGTPCPACSLANTPGRHFCRFCATPMAPERLSTAEGPYAGRRPGLARDRSRVLVRALIAAAVVVVVVGGVFGGPPAARAVQDHFATRVPVHPVAWVASHSAPGRDPKLAGDGYSNTWWGTGYAGDSAGQYLEARFAEPTDLLSLLITPGSAKNTTQADGQATPQTFDLVVKDAAGELHVSHHRINDGGTQRVDLRVRDALSVQLVLRTAWRADPRKQVAVAELEFFGRSVS
ncbi:NADase-type glycan-binding domain-containing protein [Streptomyces sp. R-07]|uniref:NADase-type glycan-binding domain-containing protein n=1 Tax=Streptomyces sp. R-07 TaxID=3404052 RepID=UPI003CECCE3E